MRIYAKNQGFGGGDERGSTKKLMVLSNCWEQIAWAVVCISIELCWRQHCTLEIGMREYMLH